MSQSAAERPRHPRHNSPTRSVCAEVILIVMEKEIQGAPRNHRMYQFIVEDNGIGISEEFMDSIFEPFEREKMRRGSVMINRLPSPTVLETSIVPPIMSSSFFAIVSPRPVPCIPLNVVFFSR